MQRVPSVTRADVERVVRRDFRPGDQDAAFGVLQEYASDSGQPHRVHLAALKLSGGNLDELRGWIEAARTDFRDVLAAAEYPLAFAQANARLSDAAREELYDADWQQYQTWLRRH